MVYITQLLFVKKGKESVFLEFEEQVIPLMTIHKGRVLYRIRPTKETYVSFEEELEAVFCSSSQALKLDSTCCVNDVAPEDINSS